MSAVKSSCLFRLFTIPAFLILAITVFADLAFAQAVAPSVTVNTFGTEGQLSNSQIFTGIKLAMLLSALVFIPSLLMSMTCFLRIAIVLSLTRQALGTAQTPANQIILGLALFLTFAVMGPVFSNIYKDAVVPFTEDQLTPSEALETAFAPLKSFMLRHTREQDVQLFLDVQKLERPDEPEDLGATVIVPAFIVSELNTAFQIAFLIFLPFLILDMIISSILTSMSMITLPPTVISLPIKLMLFVIIDGWHLIIGNLVQSYHL